VSPPHHNNIQNKHVAKGVNRSVSHPTFVIAQHSAMCMMPFGTVGHLVEMLSLSQKSSRFKVKTTTTEEMIVTTDSLETISYGSTLHDRVSHQQH